MTYKLFHGDCLTIMTQLVNNGRKVDAIIVDPPYGQTACEWDSIISFTEVWPLIKALRKEASNIVFFSKQPFTTMLNSSNIDEYKYELIWQKQQATNPMCAKKRVMPIHENISIFYKKLGTYNPQMRHGFKNYNAFHDENKKIGEIYNLKSKHRECKDGSRYPISVLNFNNVRKGFHPTQKPVDLLEWLIKTYTNEGDIVLDFTMGSGSTGVACVNLNRNFIGIEKEEKYFKIAQQRIQEAESLAFTK